MKLVEKDGSVDFGSPRNKKGEVSSEQTIDMADMDLFDAAKIPNFDSSDLMYHETLEAIEIQIFGHNPDTAHGMANSVVPGIFQTQGDLTLAANGDVTGKIGQMRVSNQPDKTFEVEASLQLTLFRTTSFRPLKMTNRELFFEIRIR